MSVNVTTYGGEVITTRLKKLLKITRICSCKTERTEMKSNLSKEFFTGLNELLKTKLSRRNSIDQ